MSRVIFSVLGVALMLASCSEQPTVNQVGVNVVEKMIFDGSWYMSRVTIDVDYEASALGTFPGDTAMDFGGALTSIPRIRWVIDENHLYAYRDYEIIAGFDGEERPPGEHLGTAVAAYPIDSHFDVRRAYNPITGEEQNVLTEDTNSRHWYEREFMRVDWSKNALPGYYGQITDLYAILGILYMREPADLFVQEQSDFPDTWRPQFHHMSCAGMDDPSEACTPDDRDWAADYDEGTLYSMNFVNQEIISPGNVPDPFTGQTTNLCGTPYGDAFCHSNSVIVRTGFLRVSDKRQYVPENWVDSRHERAGYWRVEQPTYDRSNAADDSAYGQTDFVNYNSGRHNIWHQWTDDAGNLIPYADRQVRQMVWYTTPELPAHLAKPAFELVASWNRTFMNTVRANRDQPAAVYPRVACQTADPDAYCYCTSHPDDGTPLLPDTDGDGVSDCAGRYDAFVKPEESGATNPYQCWIEGTEGAEPDITSGTADADFNGWYGGEFVGPECAVVLRVNNCNRASLADAEREGPDALHALQLTCQERGDIRYKFVSYVDQPGTNFLGIATMRGDPVTGEIITGDANIGGPALDGYRTGAMRQFDLLNGRITEEEIYTGEDIRGYLESVNQIDQPARPREDFSVANLSHAGDPQFRQQIQNRMQAAMPAINQLQGPEGRSNVYSDRLGLLAGTDIERRLTDNVETLALAGIGDLPSSGGGVTEHVLDRASPFRTSAYDQLAEFDAHEVTLGRNSIMMPSAYVDNSVMSFVELHKDWPREKVMFALNRHLYYETQLHEMGHAVGLRHNFHGSVDHENYFDDYYYINEAFPLPLPETFNTDGTPGLSGAEQIAYEDAYSEARRLRELSGIDRWMNSSTMEYTREWYERTVSDTGRYDDSAISFGYGDIVEIYDNAAGTPADAINPVNTPRINIRFYQGGETCSTDAECPYSAGGASASLLMGSNTTTGLTQTCVARDGLSGICSNYDDDAAVLTAGDTRWVSVNPRFCTDERAAGLTSSLGSIGDCNRFDEGDSYREIVRNLSEAYDRMYLFQAFRRYRRNFGIGNYLFNRLINRNLIINQNIYQNMIFRYANEPEYRESTGPFGFYDQFLASADIINMYGRILANPGVGSYTWNTDWGRYQRTSSDPDLPGAQISVPIGMGRYSRTVYQNGLSGISRVERIGSFYDKLYTLRLMAERGAQTRYTRDVPFFTNFNDVFPLEMQQIFGGMIRDEPQAYSPRLRCDSGETFPRCNQPRMVFMDFYRGDCSDPATCRPDPSDQVNGPYAGLPVVENSDSFILQLYAAIYGLTEFPTFFDTSFQNQLFLCREGNGDCPTPSPADVEGVDYVRYESDRYGQAFVAFQIDTGDEAGAEGIGFALVKEARDLSLILKVLQTYRGDFGGSPISLANLTAEQRASVAALDYELPGDPTSLSNEIDRIFGRVQSLEGFFNQLIEFERQIGISDYLRYRP